MSILTPISYRSISIFSLLIVIFLAGCGGSDTATDQSGQLIMWDRFTMRIDERFTIADISSLISSTLRPTLVQAYSIPSPSSEFFEKNIIISREASPKQDLAEYANDVSDAIRQTWGGYDRIDFSDTSFHCGEEEIPLIRHSFSLTRGDISTTGSQTVFFVQSIFKSDKMFYIVSASSDDENDRDVFEGYRDTIGCEQNK